MKTRISRRQFMTGLAATAVSSVCLPRTAWNEAQYCMVCYEFCSYQAVRIVEHNGVNCPEVDEARCRGCGACQSHCPADPVRAIMAHTHEQAPVV